MPCAARTLAQRIAHSRQVSMNGTRLGLFAPALAMVTQLTASDGKTTHGGDVVRRVVTGAAVGISSAVLGSPFYLVGTAPTSHVVARCRGC